MAGRQELVTRRAGHSGNGLAKKTKTLRDSSVNRRDAAMGIQDKSGKTESDAVGRRQVQPFGRAPGCDHPAGRSISRPRDSSTIHPRMGPNFPPAPLVSDFDYDLPAELIAQHPTPKRTESRLLVVSRTSGACESRTFPEIIDYLQAGDCLVVNNTKVIAARLFGHRRPTGGRVEAFLLEHVKGKRWLALLKPSRRLRPGAVVEIAGAPGQTFTVAEKRPDGAAEILFETDDVWKLLENAGSVPLPPYIKRAPEPEDRERYQTVYAKEPGAVAAPTAGLHFSPDVIEAIRAKGVSFVTVTLHVGAGTFKPVSAERIEDHVMYEETFELTKKAAATVNSTREKGGRVIAVGTTSVRVLETCAVPSSRTVRPQKGRTRIFLHPPMLPQVTDGLLTNFHLPKSTLLMLVSTFATVDHILAAYRLAVSEQFRFYSYGDCMLLI